MDDTLAYATVQGIREEAGLQQKFTNQAASGTVDGANKVFVANKRPLVDRDNDGSVTKSDVVAYLDGVPVAVQSVVAISGAVTLVAAPTSGKVTLDFATSPASDDYVLGLLEEAQGWVDSKINKLVDLPFDQEDNPLPPQLRTVTRLYAGALMLIRDYGTSSDTDLTSKDGYQKLKTARSLLDDFLMGLPTGAESPEEASANQASVITDGNIFGRNSHLDDFGPRGSGPQDDYFMRREL